jgi:hypothetical protein
VEGGDEEHREQRGMLHLVCPARHPVEGGDEEHREQRRMLYQCTWCILLDIQWREVMRNTEGREGMLIILVTSCSSSPRSYSENNPFKKAEK